MKKKTILMALALLCSFAQGAWAYRVDVYKAAESGFGYVEDTENIKDDARWGVHCLSLLHIVFAIEDYNVFFLLNNYSFGKMQ